MKNNIEIKYRNKHGIYIIKNTINDKVYIGSAVKLFERTRKHKEALIRGNHVNILLQNFINKYGIETLFVELLEIVLDKNDLIKTEQYWLNKVKPFKDKGFNICITAGSNLGMKMSEKNKKLLSERMKFQSYSKGSKRIPEDLKKMSERMIGNKYGLGCTMPDSHKKATSERMKGNVINKGRVKTDSQKKAISDANIGHNRSKKKTILIYKNGILIDEVIGILNTGLKYNLNSGNITGVCKGFRKSIGGFQMEYKK